VGDTPALTDHIDRWLANLGPTATPDQRPPAVDHNPSPPAAPRDTGRPTKPGAR
jgi:hypothetical protein